MDDNRVTNEKIAIRVSGVTIIWNAVLCVFKLFAGIFGKSSAMVSDAVHSASDVLSTFVVIIGVKLSNKESDKDHPYGHERFECVTAIVLSAMLFAVGAGIGYGGITRILVGQYEGLTIPGILPLIAAAVSIAVKEAMYWYTVIAAKRINSGALKADAWHHRSDAISSVGSFAGILGARMGFPVLDSVACIIICALIVKVAYDIFMDSIGKMTDKSCSDDVLAEIRGVIFSQEGVVSIDQLKTRIFGDKIYVDVEISADGDVSFRESHDLAHRVHNTIENAFPKVKHCMVHINPANGYNPKRPEESAKGESADNHAYTP